MEVSAAMEEMKVGEWLDRWFLVYTGDMAERTVELYTDARRRMKVHYPAFEDMLLGEMRPIDFQQALNDMGRKYAKSTLQHMKTLYSKAFDAAIDNHLCKWNPIRSVKLPKYASVKVVEALSQEEQDKFEEAAATLPVVDQFALMTFLLTGLRRDELRFLTWYDWDRRRNVLHIRKSKTVHGVRDVPIIPEVHMMLLYLSQREGAELSPFIFAVHGEPMDKSHLRRICNKTAKIARIRHVTPHILRHSFATRMVERGADPKSLSVIIGHSNVAFTLKRYVTADKGHLADQMMLLSTVSQNCKHKRTQ